MATEHGRRSTSLALDDRGPVVLGRATLVNAGLSAAAIHPEQAVIYSLEAVD